VEHIGVADDDPPCVPGGNPEAVRGIAVVGRNLDRKGAGAYQFPQLGLLILGQGLSGKKIETAGLLILQQSLEAGEVVTQSLSRSGRGHYHHVFTLPRLFPDLRLVGIYLFYTPASQGRPDPSVQIRGKRHKTAFLGRENPRLRDTRGKFGALQDRFQGFALFHNRIILSVSKIKRKVSIDRGKIPFYT
jgi:hypothetical protein